MDEIGKRLNYKIDMWHEFLELSYADRIVEKRMFNRYNEANIAILEFFDNNNPANSQSFYACSQINNKDKKEGFKYAIEEAKKKGKDVAKAIEYLNKFVVKTESNIFNSIDVNVFRSINSEGCTCRNNDSEFLLLNHTAYFINNNKITDFKIVIFTYLEPCLSCDKIIIDFLSQYPQATITLYYKQPYNKSIT